MKKLDLGSAALVLSVAAFVLAAVTLFVSPAPRKVNSYTLNNPVDYAATCISLGGHPGEPYACYR